MTVETSLIMPQLGESIAEATIVDIYIKEGDVIEADQNVMAVETSKATMDITTAYTGKVKTITAEVGSNYAIGTTLAILEVDEPVAKNNLLSGHNTENLTTTEEKEESNLHFATQGDSYQESVTPIAPHIEGLPVPLEREGVNYISPRMRARMQELGLKESDIAAIKGTGKGHRVTIEDLEIFLNYVDNWPSTTASPMRMAVANSMLRSWSRPLATVGFPVKIDALLGYRKKQDPKPGLTLYVLRAFALALSENPEVAGMLIGNKIVHPQSIDLGFAVQVKDGVLVPILRNCHQRTVNDMQREYDALIRQAQARKLDVADHKGGIATVTNFGSFGLTWGTPVPLPSETLILGIAAGTKKPHWDKQTETFIPITETELCLTFDHRVIDGGDAGKILQKIAILLNQPEQL